MADHDPGTVELVDRVIWRAAGGIHLGREECGPVAEAVLDALRDAGWGPRPARSEAGRGLGPSDPPKVAPGDTPTGSEGSTGHAAAQESTVDRAALWIGHPQTGRVHSVWDACPTCATFVEVSVFVGRPAADRWAWAWARRPAPIRDDPPVERPISDPPDATTRTGDLITHHWREGHVPPVSDPHHTEDPCRWCRP